MLAAKLTRPRGKLVQRCLQVVRERLRPVLGGVGGHICGDLGSGQSYWGVRNITLGGAAKLSAPITVSSS